MPISELHDTLISLNEWATLIGEHPLPFNGLATDLMRRENYETPCDEVWFQLPHQAHSDGISIEELAQALALAEKSIAAQTGYFLRPTWTTTVVTPDFERWPKSQIIQLPHGGFISGGVRGAKAIANAVTIVRTDEDNDGYFETATVTAVVKHPLLDEFGQPVLDDDGNTVFVVLAENESEVRAFYPGRGGQSRYEIRPISVKFDTVSDITTATLTFKIWQAVNVEVAKTATSDNPMLYDNDTIYLGSVDVWRVWNNIGVQAVVKWDNGKQQTARLLPVNARLGIVKVIPSVWNEELGLWVDTALAYKNRLPYEVEMSYYSGGIYDLDYAACVLAIANCDREFVVCGNANEKINYWRRDMAYVGREQGYSRMTPDMYTNPFGTTRGAIHAWREISHPGRRLG